MTLIGFILWVIFVSVPINLFLEPRWIPTVSSAICIVLGMRMLIVSWAHSVMNKRETVLLYTLLGLVALLMAAAILITSANIRTFGAFMEM